MDLFISLNRNIAQEWNTVKPYFRKAFGDRTDPMVFANSMFNIKLTSYNNNLYTYTAAITKIMGLHNEKYLNSDINFAAGHSFTDAQQASIKGYVDTGFHEVHDDLTK